MKPHEEHQFWWDRSPDGKVKDPFGDWTYKREVMKESDKLRNQPGWKMPDEYNPYVPIENLG